MKDGFASMTDLLGNFRLVKSGGIPMDERRQLLGELETATGLPLWKILKRTEGFQTPEDLRFILSAMKNVPKAKNAAHAFFTITYTPKDK